MKTINGFLNLSVETNILKTMYYNELVEFYNNDIPEHIIEKLSAETYVDYLYENLKTHNYKKLQKKLKNEYPDFEFEDYEAGSFYIITDKMYALKKDNDFKHLLEFYGYYVSKYNWEFGQQKGTIYIEPNDSKDMSDYVYNECHGIVYHICTKSTAESILKSDLRCKDAKYRKYPKRIFIYADPNGINTDDFVQLAKQLKSPFNKEPQVVVKINLRELGGKVQFTFMKDPAMHNKGCLFTYNRIPKEICSIIKTI